MIACDGYSIEQYPLQNKVVITLSPTIHTMQDMPVKPRNRRVEFTMNELLAILVAIKGILEWKEEKNE